MGDKSAIEWTDATWNPVTGCTKVSPGCKHEAVPEEFIRRVFEVMEQADRHVLQVLTKRAERLAELAPRLPWPASVWQGVSVENARYTSRVAHLQRVPAAVRAGVPGEACNVGGGREVENIALTRQILRLLGKPPGLIQAVGVRPGHDRGYARDCRQSPSARVEADARRFRAAARGDGALVCGARGPVACAEVGGVQGLPRQAVRGPRTRLTCADGTRHSGSPDARR